MTNYRNAVLLFALCGATLAVRTAYAAEFNVVDVLTVTGNTGMGTTTPAAKLHISSGTLWIDGDATNSLVAIGRLGIGITSPSGALSSMLVVSGAASIGSGYTGNAAPADGLIVQGNTSIGTTNSTNKLDVNGGMAIGTYAGANAAGANNLIVSGNVGIGLTNPSVALDVAGSIKMSGGVSVYSVTNAYCKDTVGTLTTAANCQTRNCTTSVTYRNNTYFACAGTCCQNCGMANCANSAVTGKMFSP